MVISSIVVSLSFLALENVQRQVRSINQTFDRQQKILKLERMLAMDLETYQNTFDKVNNRILFYGKNDTVQYRFLNSKVYRNKDSIELSIQNTVFYLEGNPVTAGKFDALEFQFSDTYNQQGFFLYRRNDAFHFINR
jgi:Na+-transporting NADH:ubiquinone oxidoreductase subunit NqrC